MPKLSNRPPKLCFKKSNNTAFVCVDGKQLYMGKIGAEAEKNYRHFVATWANGTLESFQSSKTGTSLEVLFSEYLLYIGSIKNYSVADIHRTKLLIQRILSLYPNMFADNFRPVELEAVRNSFKKSGFIKNGHTGEYSRNYLNRLTNLVRRIFKWGVSKMLVKPETHEWLRYVQPLQEGRTDAPEVEARENVSDEDLNKTFPYLRKYYRDIIQLMRITGMRPSEVCRMRVCDIDNTREDGIWLYTPVYHKTLIHGKKRIIPLGTHAQNILNIHLEGKGKDEYLFTPSDAKNDLWDELRANRKSKITPSQKAREEKAMRRKYKKLNDQITPTTLSRNVANAIKRAEKDGVPIKKWTPYCVRHQLITDISEKEGPVASQRIAGHSSLKTTEIYDHSTLTELVALAKKYG